jgi:hypothetical protein
MFNQILGNSDRSRVCAGVKYVPLRSHQTGLQYLYHSPSVLKCFGSRGCLSLGGFFKMPYCPTKLLGPRFTNAISCFELGPQEPNWAIIIRPALHCDQSTNAVCHIWDPTLLINPIVDCFSDRAAAKACLFDRMMSYVLHSLSGRHAHRGFNPAVDSQHHLSMPISASTCFGKHPVPIQQDTVFCSEGVTPSDRRVNHCVI